MYLVFSIQLLGSMDETKIGVLSLSKEFSPPSITKPNNSSFSLIIKNKTNNFKIVKILMYFCQIEIKFLPNRSTF